MRENSTLLIVSAGDKDPYVVMEAQDKDNFVNGAEWLPWRPKPVLYQIEDFIGDCLMMKNVRKVHDNVLGWYREQGITHVVALPSEEPYQGPSLLFGPSNEFQLAIVMYWCAAHNKYRLMHCGESADLVAAWIDGMQEVWGLDASAGLQKENATHH